MRFFTPLECKPIFVATHLSVSENGRLIANQHSPTRVERLAGGPAGDVENLGDYVEALLRWLPNDRGRLLWLSDWSPGLRNTFEAFMAVRAGLGETRGLEETPGHYIGPFSWTWDQEEMTKDQAQETGILAGLLFMVMGSSWDGWLAAESCGDVIEFWEGNVLFYSGNPEKIAEASALQKQYGCRQALA